MSESERKSARAGAQARYVQTARQGQRRADRHHASADHIARKEKESLFVIQDSCIYTDRQGQSYIYRQTGTELLLHHRPSNVSALPIIYQHSLCLSVSHY